MSQTHAFPSLGFGIGFRTPHYSHILTHKPKTIEWLEVISENFMNIGGRPRAILTEVREYYPVVLHGVGLSIGSPEPLCDTYLKNLRELAGWLNPAMISDHLCFTSYGRHNSHDLLPVPYTRPLLARISDKLKRVQDTLGRRIMLENPSAYAAYHHNDMGEDEFLAAMCDLSGCGILLDLNNLFVNQSNLGLDPHKYLRTIPLDAVGQFHLAGHSIEGAVRIDTHDHPVTDEVWKLYAHATKKWTHVSTLLEWDDHIPDFDDLVLELDKARQHHGKDVGPSSSIQTDSSIHLSKPQECAQQDFFGMATDLSGIDLDDRRLTLLDHTLPVPAFRGIHVYNNAYFARLRDVMRTTFPTLAGVTSEEGFDAIAGHYLMARPPSRANVDYVGEDLGAFLANTEIPGFDFGVPNTVLSEIASWDWTDNILFTTPDGRSPITRSALAELNEDLWSRVGFEFSDAMSVLDFTFDVESIVAAIKQDQQPSLPCEKASTYVFWRCGFHVYNRQLSREESIALSNLRSGKAFESVCQDLAEHLDLDGASVVEMVVPWLLQWIDDGMVIKMGTPTI